MATTFKNARISEPAVSFTFLTSVSSTGRTITMPSNIIDGDIAILHDQSTVFLTGNANQVIPAGFTKFAGTTTVDSTGSRLDISYKRLVVSDAGRVLTGMSEFGQRKILAIFRPNSPGQTGNFQILDIANEGPVAGTPATQTINIVGATRPIIAFASYSSTGAISTRTFTSTGANIVELNTNTEAYMKYAIFNPTDTISANVTVSMSDGGNNGLSSYYIRFIN
jgi:hypothetical protein